MGILNLGNHLLIIKMKFLIAFALIAVANCVVLRPEPIFGPKPIGGWQNGKDMGGMKKFDPIVPPLPSPAPVVVPPLPSPIGGWQNGKDMSKMGGKSFMPIKPIGGWQTDAALCHTLSQSVDGKTNVSSQDDESDVSVHDELDVSDQEPSTDVSHISVDSTDVLSHTHSIVKQQQI